MNDLKFLGTGMKFPPQVNKSTGRFTLSSGAQNIKESVYIILMTMRGERWLEPYFGSRIMSYTFMDMSITMLSIMTNELRSTILEQEPRISDVDVDVSPEIKEGCIIINIAYTIATTNQRDNMVFPFYLNNSSEEEVGDEA